MATTDRMGAGIGMVTRSRLYSMREVERLTGRNRLFVAGLVEGLRIPLYAGPGRARVIDEGGLSRLLVHLAYESRSPMPAPLT